MNAKEKGGLDTRIRMSIIKKKTLKHKIYSDTEQKVPGNSNDNRFSYKNDYKMDSRPVRNDHKKDSRPVDKSPKSSLPSNCNDENELGIKQFEYVEAKLVDEEVMQGLYDTMIGIACSDETSSNLQDKIESIGVEDIKEIGLSNRKFILQSEIEETGMVLILLY